MARKKLEITEEMKKGAEAAAAAELEKHTKAVSKSEQKRLEALLAADREHMERIKKGKPTVRALGWKPQKIDIRDKQYRFATMMPILPKKYDMSPAFPPVYDQGQLGSCTANAALGAVQFTEIELTGKLRPTMSRLYTYYYTRKLEGTVGYDSGATIRDVFKSLNKFGYCFEKLWKYDINQYTQMPPASAIDQALQHKIRTQVDYYAVPKAVSMLKQVIAENNPIVFGFTVYESFMSEYVRKTGMVPMPRKSERVEGGHAVCIVGYDDEKEAFLIRNSWGKNWGISGYCWMPYNFVLTLGSDFWTLKSVPAVAQEVAA